MNQQTAQLVLHAITAVASVIWFAGLMFLALSAKQRRAAPDVRFDIIEPSTKRMIRGRAEVDGEPEALAARAASMLAKGNVANLGSLRITAKTDRSVAFEGVAGGLGIGRFIRQGTLQMTRASSGRVRVDYAIEPKFQLGLLVVGAIFQLLGLAAIAIGFYLINTYLLPSPNAAVRAQSVQMVQVIHFLWPPFLFGGLYRWMHVSLRSAFETFCQNLQFYEA